MFVSVPYVDIYFRNTM